MADDDTPPASKPYKPGPAPLGPLPTPRLSADGPRDTSPPRPSPKLDYLPSISNEPQTNPRIMLERVYGEAKRAKRRRPFNIAAAITTAATALGGAGYEMHSLQERQARTEQQLQDHIDSEAEHHADVTKRLDQLIQFELDRRRP